MRDCFFTLFAFSNPILQTESVGVSKRLGYKGQLALVAGCYGSNVVRYSAPVGGKRRGRMPIDNVVRRGTDMNCFPYGPTLRR